MFTGGTIWVLTHGHLNQPMGWSQMNGLHHNRGMVVVGKHFANFACCGLVVEIQPLNC